MNYDVEKEEIFLKKTLRWWGLVWILRKVLKILNDFLFTQYAHKNAWKFWESFNK